MQTVQMCISCGSSTHTIDGCWGEMEYLEDMKNASKNISLKNTTTGTKGTDITMKCEAAISNWLKSKKNNDSWNLVSNSKSKCPSQSDLIVCQTCEMLFDYTQEMKVKYERRGWVDPKVCKNCSQERFVNNVT